MTKKEMNTTVVGFIALVVAPIATYYISELIGGVIVDTITKVRTNRKIKKIIKERENRLINNNYETDIIEEA